MALTIARERSVMSDSEYPRDIAKRLARILAAESLPQPRAHAQSTLAAPSEPQVAQLLDAAWAATTIDEEGRRTVFTLIFVERAALADSYKPLVFEKPRPLTPGAIAKLAPAADPRETLILVGSGVNGALEMWGLLFIGDTSFASNQRMRPPYLLVHGFRAGAFFVRWQARAIVRYVGGAAYWYGQGDDTIPGLLRPASEKAAQALGLPTAAAIPDTLQEVATRMVNAGHGGTLLVFERFGSRARPARLHVPSQSTFTKPDTTLRDAMVSYEQFVSSAGGTSPRADPAQVALQRDRISRAYRDAADHVARLANVDGAVLLRTDLSVIAFGATIDMQKGAKFKLGHRDPQTKAIRTKPVEDLSGHRHKSAAHFCFAQTPRRRRGSSVAIVVAFAIVASQDGKLSLFARAPGLTGFDVLEVSPLVLGDAI